MVLRFIKFRSSKKLLFVKQNNLWQNVEKFDLNGK